MVDPMVRPSVRADFSRARFLAAAQFIATTRGVMEVSYASVAALCRAPVSSIQRRFPTAELLRRAALETWIFEIQSVEAGDVGPGVAGLWNLLCRWFHAHARHPLPFALLNARQQEQLSPEREALCGMAVEALGGWQKRIRQQAERIPPEQWRLGIDRALVAQHLFVASTAHGPSAAVIGELAAIESAASWCWGLLQDASADENWERYVSERIPDLIPHAARLLQLRPALGRIDEESATAEGARPHRGRAAVKSRRKGPATWDAFLAEATEELDEYRKKHREDED